MKTFHKTICRLRTLFRKQKLDAEMAEEMRAHLEMQEAANRATGMNANAARRQFRHLEGIKETTRDQRGWVWLEMPAKDVRFRAHTLRRTSGFTAVAVLTLALGIETGAAMAATPVTGPAVPGFETCDHLIPSIMEKWAAPGAALAVALDGRIVYARGFGLADRESGRLVQPDTRFRLASLSKILTATMVLKLVEQGRLSLDDRAFPLLNYPTPTYAGASRDARLDQITVRQLLSHTAGWNSNTAFNPFLNVYYFEPAAFQMEIAQAMGVAAPASAEVVARYMVGQPLQAAPGTAYSYSNLGYLILGRLIELKTGVSYENAVQQLVEPCYVSGLHITGSRRSELAADEAVSYDYPGAPLCESHLGDGLVPFPYSRSTQTFAAEGGWAMSAIEYLRFLLALDGQGGAPALLQPASIAAMRTTQFPGSNYGYGWITSFGSSGGGGHDGSMPGTYTMGFRSDDGRFRWAALFNSCPNGAAGWQTTVGAMEAELYAGMHTAEMGIRAAATPEHDFTASSLGWDAWQRRNLATTDSTERGDPDYDGVPNLVEYAAGLDPTRCDAQPPVSLGVGIANVPVLTYRRLVLGHPLTWSVEASADGKSWIAVDGANSQTSVNADGTLSVSLALPSALRARLRVGQPASGAEATVEAPIALQDFAVAAGGSATLTAVAPVGAPLQWRRNGVVIPGATAAGLALTNVQPADAGFYTVDIGGAVNAIHLAAILGIRSSEKVIGDGDVVGADILHPTGNIYDQVLLTGAAATITADPGQVTRMSFIDLTDDIVQVEFSGAGSLTVVLAGATEPALPLNYNQQVRYVKGHATLVVADADASTYVSVFSVGRANAVNQALFKDGVTYDGVADVAALAIQSACGKTAGLFLGNAHFFATAGIAGLHAAGVEASGPVRLGNLSAFDQAQPMLVFGSVAEVTITGGDLQQDNGQPVQVQGIGHIRFAAGGNSSGAVLPVQTNRATLVSYGVDVTATVVAP